MRGRPDFVGFKVGEVAAGEFKSVMPISALEESSGEPAHLCPIKTHLARKIGFGPGGDADYARWLAQSEIVESENFVDAVIYFKTCRTEK